MRLTRTVAGFVLAVVASAVWAGPAAAYVTISETGPHGNYWLDDTSEMPAATCKYGQVAYSNWTYFKWMQVDAPHVFAADRNSDKREKRLVTWQWKLQHEDWGDPLPNNWKTVKSSAVQKATAYEDAEAGFTPLRINYDIEALDPEHQGRNGEIFRALVVIKWFRGDGTLESTVKLTPSFYYIKSVFGNRTSGANYCSWVVTSG